MKHKWVRGALVAVLAAVLLFVGSFVVDRVWLAVFDQRIYEFLRPTEADVLDGRVANEERLAAISEVSKFSGGLKAEGVSPVGEIIWTACDVGQNNYKVHDGFRLSCAASVASYVAWSGEYEDTAAAIREKIARKCPDLQLDAGPRQPTPGAATGVTIYKCSDRTSVWLMFATTQQLNASSLDFTIGMTTADSRRLSGPTVGELREGLSEHQWFARIIAGQTYFEDRP